MSKQPYSRRRLIRYLGLAAGTAAFPPAVKSFASPKQQPYRKQNSPSDNPHRVVLVKTDDRVSGTQKALELLQPTSFANKSVFIKPNYNTADIAPASTAPEILETLANIVRADKPSRITVGDRSGMAQTRQVLQQRQVFSLGNRYGFQTLVFDELAREDWQYFPPEGTNWQRGFAIARPVLDSDAIINACCLKTHRFGGHFTLSLKNTIGMVARRVPGDSHDYMRELHASPNQRLMIAEVNKVYRPAVVLIDGVDAFVAGGPERGRRVKAGVILAGIDRLAVDAVGIAILRSLGTTPEVQKGSIWSQAQIRRAADLGLGAINAEQIEIITGDSASKQYGDRLRQYLT